MMEMRFPTVSRYPQIWVAAISIWLLPVIIYAIVTWMFDSKPIVLSAFDAAIMALFFLGGFFIILNRKIFWFVAIAILFLIAVVNIVNALIMSSKMQTIDYQFILSSSVVFSTGLISYYYRFPYLDSRDTGWFGIAHRFRADFPAQLDETLQGRVICVSISGVRFVAGTTAMENLEVGRRMKLNVPDLGLSHVPVEIRGVQEREVRVKFRWLGFRQFRDLKRRLQALPMKPESPADIVE